jgi:PhnB protein
MMQLSPYLSFNGQCKTAFKFYEQCLGGKIVAIMTYGESPMAAEVSSEWHDKVMHAQLTVGDRDLMGADSPPDQHEETKGISVLLSVDDPAEAEQLFHALAADGMVRMPIQQTFWSVRFGMLVDQFGIPWMINCNQPA